MFMCFPFEVLRLRRRIALLDVFGTVLAVTFARGP
jgi:hypothetical protein